MVLVHCIYHCRNHVDNIILIVYIICSKIFIEKYVPSYSEFNNIDITKNISPCDVENAMCKHSKEPYNAIKLIEENKMKTLEKF